MPKSDTQFTSDNQPKGRGKSKKTMIVDALKSRGKTEEGFWELVVDLAIEGDQQMIALLSKKLFPDTKATYEKYKISLGDGDKRIDRAEAIMNAAMTANIPIDIAERFLNSLADVAKIEEVDSILGRLAILEERVNP